ncbi:hypothetical protein NQ317_019313 [Molorchus minor]|uniref:LysM domain-containing protein n=1 Tax=Molorchus minor TaxID=1323400 RepID=A0ABQ9J4B3_9CUCU|nr:hypothetical protein NQ317_019313 [Molorchus minor]
MNNIITMDRGSYEKLSIRDSARSLKKYGSTSKHVTRNENYIKHMVSNTDTLQGIALKHNVTIEQIRRANKLWASDSLFLREFLLIPSTEPHTSSSSESAVVSPSSATSPTMGSFDEDSIDEFLHKIDASIASTKEEVKKTSVNSEFATDLNLDAERRRPAISRMKQMVNNNGSNELYNPPHTVVVQQGKKVRTSLRQHEAATRRINRARVPWNTAPKLMI